MWIKIFIVGWIILVVAIFINYIAGKFGIATWYGFVETIEKYGIMEGMKRVGLVSALFLFVVYPFFLGVAAFFSLRFLK